MSLTPPIVAAPTFTFKVPPKARQYPTDPESVTLRAFTVGQELDALKASSATGNRFDYELVERSCIAVNGKPHDQGESLIERCSPKVRALLVRGLNKMSLPEDDDIKGFLDSVEVAM